MTLTLYCKQLLSGIGLLVRTVDIFCPMIGITPVSSQSSVDFF